MRILRLLLVATAVCVQCATVPPANPAEVTAVVESFYAAIKKGDPAAAMSFIAPDAVFLESGKLETRAEYRIQPPARRHRVRDAR